MKKLRIILLLLMADVVLFLTCAGTLDTNLLATDADRDKPLSYLSEYGFFEGDLTALQPAADLHAYALNTPLFSDYAHKARFVYVPADSSLRWQDREVLDMPVGAVLIKHFYYPADERDSNSERRFIET